MSAAAKSRPSRGIHKKRTGILGCVTTDDHHPDQDKAFWHAKLQWIREHKPDRIEINGDFLELESVQMHGKRLVTDLVSLEEDLKIGREALRDLRAAAGPECEITYLEGNHETRLTRYIAENVPGPLQKSLRSLPDALHLDKLDIVWIPESQQPIEVGTMDLLHGHQIPGRMLPKHHAAKVADLYAAPGRSVVIGHSHRPQRFVRASKRGNATGIALGAGRTLDPKWMKGGPGGWALEWLIYTVVDGITHATQVPFENGRMVWGSKVYGRAGHVR